MLQMASPAKSVNSSGAQTSRDLVPRQQNVGVRTPTPTHQTYDVLDAALAHFNHDLLGGILPGCLVTLQRQTKTLGYFSPGKFAAINGDARRVDEIALNPAYFRTSPPRDVLSTLVHEMVHAWQHHFGKAPRPGYHNAEWAAAMHSIGLQPYSNNDPDKETGYSVDHRIVEGGPFDVSYQAFEATGQNSPLGRRVRTGSQGEKAEARHVCLPRLRLES